VELPVIICSPFSFLNEPQTAKLPLRDSNVLDYSALYKLTCQSLDDTSCSINAKETPNEHSKLHPTKRNNRQVPNDENEAEPAPKATHSKLETEHHKPPLPPRQRTTRGLDKHKGPTRECGNVRVTEECKDIRSLDFMIETAMNLWNFPTTTIHPTSDNSTELEIPKESRQFKTMPKPRKAKPLPVPMEHSTLDYTRNRVSTLSRLQSIIDGMLF
jgi:hypothetical protein